MDKDITEYEDLINEEFDWIQDEVCPAGNCKDYPFAEMPFEYQSEKAWLIDIKWLKSKLFHYYKLAIDRNSKIAGIWGWNSNYLFDKEKISKFNNLEKCSSEKENLTRKVFQIHKIPEQKLRNEDYSWTFKNKDSSNDIWIFQDAYISYKVNGKPVVLIIRCHHIYNDKENDPTIWTSLIYLLLSKEYFDFKELEIEKGWKGKRKKIDNISIIFNSENTGL